MMDSFPRGAKGLGTFFLVFSIACLFISMSLVSVNATASWTVNSQTDWENGTFSSSLAQGGELSLLYFDGFEDGDLSEYSINDPDFNIKTDHVKSGSYSAGIADSSTSGVIADLDFSTSQKGKITYIRIYSRENSSSTGGGVRFKNASGNDVFTFAFNNPQWDINGSEVYAGDGYQRWVEWIFENIDYSSDSFDYKITDPVSGHTETGSGNFKNSSSKIAWFRIADYNNSNWLPSSNNMYQWFDDMTFSKGASGTWTSKIWDAGCRDPVEIESFEVNSFVEYGTSENGKFRIGVDTDDDKTIDNWSEYKDLPETQNYYLIEYSGGDFNIPKGYAWQVEFVLQTGNSNITPVIDYFKLYPKIRKFQFNELLKVSGTIFTRNENAEIFAQVVENNVPKNDATVNIDIISDNGSTYESGTMDNIPGSNGIYSYDFQAPNRVGVYVVDAVAIGTNENSYSSSTFQVAGFTEDISDIKENVGHVLDNLEAHRSAVESKISDIWGWVDSLEAGQTNILADLSYIKSNMANQDNVSDILTELGTIEGFVDDVESYTDTLESGQSTLQGYVDTLEIGQGNILDNLDLIKTYTDQVEGYTDGVEGYVDNVESYMGIAAMQAHNENLYNYLKNTITPYVDQVEGYTDQVEGYTNSLESGQTWIKDYLENTIYSYLTDTIKPALDNITDNCNTIYNYLTGTVKPQLDDMKENIDATLDNAAANYTYLTGTIKPELDEIQENVDYAKSQTDNIKTVVDNIQGYQDPIYDNVLATYTNTQTIISNTGDTIDNCNAIYNYLKNTIYSHLMDIRENVGYILDNLEAHRSAVESKISGISDNLNYIKSNMANQDNVGDILAKLGIIEGFVDNVEDYTDTLESGQSTLKSYTDTLESGQSNILDNLDLIKTYTDQVESYTDDVEGYVDNVESYMGIATMQADNENLYHYLKSTVDPHIEEIELYCDNIQNYTDNLESGQSDILDSIDNISIDNLEYSDANVRVIKHDRFAAYAVIAIMFAILSPIIAMTGVLKWKW